jgi:YbbR domain-containing protein
MVNLPPGITLKKMIPATVELTLDAMGEKSVPIQVDWVGPLPTGLRLVSVEVVPARTRILGSRRKLETVSTIYTDPVTLDGIEASGSFNVGLALQDGVQGIAPGAQERVTVHYVVASPAP